MGCVMGCKTCGCALGPRNKSGYCRPHIAARNAADPVWRAKQADGVRRKLSHDPVYLDQKRAAARALSADPDIVERRTRRFRQDKVWEAGHRAALDPEVRARAGRSISERRLGWCPVHLRAEYTDLIRRKRFTAAEARAMIEDQNELDMARWRRSIGVADEKAEIATLAAAVRARNLTPFERAMQAAAAVFDVTEDQIMSRDRSRHISIARYSLAYTLQRSGMSTPKIAAALGRADHTTAIHLIRRAHWFAAHDMKFAAQMAHVIGAWDGDLQVAA